jgi:hypothetical protein
VTRVSGANGGQHHLPLEGRPDRQRPHAAAVWRLWRCRVSQGRRRAEPGQAANELRNTRKEIVRFFQTGKPPVPNEETIEIFEFMDAAQRSKEAGGQPMRLR